MVTQHLQASSVWQPLCWIASTHLHSPEKLDFCPDLPGELLRGDLPPLLRQHLAGVVPARLPVDHEVHDTVRPCEQRQLLLNRVRLRACAWDRRFKGQPPLNWGRGIFHQQWTASH